ncbi:unnamed protein product [Protopolystoma xenopodis]|uniref:Uncharacterized protein n=1 Tax=Protopolystoma xenopodis TaxID=117903 RepID=A0A3S5CDX0_9PLAT|nr:unnamed protein product [Protopolystoma xenopodis]
MDFITNFSLHGFFFLWNFFIHPGILGRKLASNGVTTQGECHIDPGDACSRDFFQISAITPRISHGSIRLESPSSISPTYSADSLRESVISSSDLPDGSIQGSEQSFFASSLSAESWSAGERNQQIAALKVSKNGESVVLDNNWKEEVVVTLCTGEQPDALEASSDLHQQASIIGDYSSISDRLLQPRILSFGPFSNVRALRFTSNANLLGLPPTWSFNDSSQEFRGVRHLLPGKGVLVEYLSECI